jgi:AcrR family transcriptional regulator
MKNVAEHEPKMRILLAAKKLFAERGFDGTSVRQICELAGVNVALVSYYFGGKEKMFDALFEHFYPVGALEQYEETFKDPVAGLSLIIREVIRYRWEQPEMAMIMQREIYLESPRRETIKTYVFPVWRKLREILELGKKQGVFHYRSLDNTMLFILATLVFPRGNPFHQPLLTEKLVTVEEQVEDTIRFVFGGLGCPLES